MQYTACAALHCQRRDGAPAENRCKLEKARPSLSPQELRSRSRIRRREATPRRRARSGAPQSSRGQLATTAPPPAAEPRALPIFICVLGLVTILNFSQTITALGPLSRSRTALGSRFRIATLGRYPALEPLCTALGRYPPLGPLSASDRDDRYAYRPRTRSPPRTAVGLGPLPPCERSPFDLSFSLQGWGPLTRPTLLRYYYYA